jgi:phosphonatase-like hydrolase
MAIKAVLFDFIGTTIVEKENNTIHNCFEMAFRQHGVSLEGKDLQRSRGKNKKEIVHEILKFRGREDEPLEERIYSAFKKNLEKASQNFALNDGVTELFHFLRKKQIKIGLGTALPGDQFQNIYEHIPWKGDWFDYIGTGSQVVRTRPHPDMIFAMMSSQKITQKTSVIKVGDTVADIEEGKNAGVLTAGILSGTQSKQELAAANPDFLIHHLRELEKIINDASEIK